MTEYENYGGNSNVVAYEIGYDYIDVRFAGGSVYRYSYYSAGEENVETMKELAISGSGLNSYIMRRCRTLYERKIR